MRGAADGHGEQREEPKMKPGRGPARRGGARARSRLSVVPRRHGSATALVERRWQAAIRALLLVLLVRLLLQLSVVRAALLAGEQGHDDGSKQRRQRTMLASGWQQQRRQQRRCCGGNAGDSGEAAASHLPATLGGEQSQSDGSTCLAQAWLRLCDQISRSS